MCLLEDKRKELRELKSSGNSPLDRWMKTMEFSKVSKSPSEALSQTVFAATGELKGKAVDESAASKFKAEHESD